MDEIKSGQVPFPDPAGNQKPVPVIYLVSIEIISNTKRNEINY